MIHLSALKSLRVISPDTIVDFSILGRCGARYLSSMSPAAAGHSSLAHGNADLDDGFDDLDLRHSTRGRARRINGRIAVRRNGDRFRENGTGVTYVVARCTVADARGSREGESRGHNKTTTSPASRTAILLLLSLFPLLSRPPPLSLRVSLRRFHPFSSRFS